MAENIGFIGLGVMGKPMAKHLIAAGHHLTVHNRSRGAVDELVAAGATAAAAPAEVARASTIVITMLPDTPDVERVLTAADGVLSGLQKGAIVIDMSSISPVVTERLAMLVADKGGSMLDAPVSGGEIGAINAQLSIMVGGDEAAFERAAPVIGAYAKAVSHMGAAGAGQLTKMVNQICIAGLVQGLAEASAFASRAGLDAEAVFAAVSKGAAQSWQMDNRWRTMAQGKFDFGFAVDWMRKDLGLVLEEARANGARVEVTALVDQFYAEVQAMGGARWDTSSLAARLMRS
jgi:3-hydroxyisobutyrate dehydrogenase